MVQFTCKPRLLPPGRSARSRGACAFVVQSSGWQPLTWLPVGQYQPRSMTCIHTYITTHVRHWSSEHSNAASNHLWNQIDDRRLHRSLAICHASNVSCMAMLRRLRLLVVKSRWWQETEEIHSWAFVASCQTWAQRWIGNIFELRIACFLRKSGHRSIHACRCVLWPSYIWCHNKCSRLLVWDFT